MSSNGRSMLLAVVALLVTDASVCTAQDAGVRAKHAYERAIELESQGNHAAALPLLWDASGLAPRDPDIQNRLGEALERLGALDAAIDAYRLALAERPGFRSASNNLILALVKAGRGPEAVERAGALVAAAPDDPDRHFTLGLAQSEQDVDAAVASLRRATGLAPRHVLARYNLALVLRRADRLPDAIDELRRALEIEPRPEAHYTLGVIYWHQGDLSRAARELGAAVAARPEYVEAHEALGGVRKAGRDWSGAAASLRRAIALRPGQSTTYYALAQVLRLRGDERGAREAIGEAERLRARAQQEQEASVWTVVGSQRLSAGDAVGALVLFRRATAAFDGYAPAHYQTGLTLRRLGQHAAARAAFVRAQQLNPGLVPPPEPREP